MNTRVGVIAEDAAGQWTGGTAPPLLRAGWLARGAARLRWRWTAPDGEVCDLVPARPGADVVA